MNQTAYWYVHTDQYRYDPFTADDLGPRHGRVRRHERRRTCSPSRPGWAGCRRYPTFNRSPLDLADEAEAAGMPTGDYVVEQLKSGDLRFAVEDPDAPEN